MARRTFGRQGRPRAGCRWMKHSGRAGWAVVPDEYFQRMSLAIFPSDAVRSLALMEHFTSHTRL